MSAAGTTCHQVQLADETDSYTTVVGVEIFALMPGSTPMFDDVNTVGAALRLVPQSGDAVGSSVGVLDLVTIADDEIVGTLSATGKYGESAGAQYVATFDATRCPSISP